MGKIYGVVVNGFRGEKVFIELGNTEEEMQRFTVGQLKEKIAEKLPQAAGEENLRLIFTDKVLEGDTSLLSEYGIQHMSVIQQVIKVAGGGGPEPPHPHTDDGLGDKEGETLRSKECLAISMSQYGLQHMSVIQQVIKVAGRGGPEPPHPHTDDGLGDKEGETRRSKECLAISMSKTENKFSVGPK